MQITHPHQRGMDISNHQSGMDVERVVRENDFTYVFILTNDGTFVNAYFKTQSDAAKRAGAIVVPYFYLRPNWAQTVQIHLEVSKGFGVSLPDVETGSGGYAELANATAMLHEHGRKTPLLYWPNFHWVSVGSPDLSPLRQYFKGHWKSWYLDNSSGPYESELAGVPDYVWNDNRGGFPVEIIQFTSSGRVAGYSGNVDLNYFIGTRKELEELLGEPTEEENDMIVLVKGNERPDCYVVFITGDGIQKRHVEPGELTMLEQLTGKSLTLVDQWVIDTVGNASLIGQGAWETLPGSDALASINKIERNTEELSIELDYEKLARAILKVAAE